jgi:hypothetical protein
MSVERNMTADESDEFNEAASILTAKLYVALQESGEDRAGIVVWAALNIIGTAIVNAHDRRRVEEYVKRSMKVLLRRVASTPSEFEHQH